uniref:Uncharacterized protein n=1 Tax=Cucumis melo TaxID=3656 RepID=A0A9I9DSB2_CUCME
MGYNEGLEASIFETEAEERNPKEGAKNRGRNGRRKKMGRKKVTVRDGRRRKNGENEEGMRKEGFLGVKRERGRNEKEWKGKEEECCGLRRKRKGLKP